MSKGIMRLHEEFKYIKKTGFLANIGGSAGPINKDYLHWKACFLGPKDTPYEGGYYFIEIKFKYDYPDSPPLVQMRTPTYHPNINNTIGHICSSYIFNWKPTNNIVGIIYMAWSILAEGNPQSAYMREDKEKALKFKELYANENQNYDWNNSWNKGWSIE